MGKSRAVAPWDRETEPPLHARRHTDRQGVARLIAGYVTTVHVGTAADRRDHAIAHRLVLPIGPVRLYVDRGHASGARQGRPAVLIMTGYTLAQPGLTFDLGSSLSAGTPVFRSRPGSTSHLARFGTAAGVIWLRHGFSRELTETALSHELVHVLQYDASFIQWSTPAERWLFAHIPGGTAVGRYVDLGLNAAALAGLNALISYHDRPWEREAHFLTGIRIHPVVIQSRR